MPTDTKTKPCPKSALREVHDRHDWSDLAGWHVCAGYSTDDQTMNALRLLGIEPGLLACDWGRIVSTPDDGEECPKMAKQRVCVHRPPEEGGAILVQVCDLHNSLLMEQTTPSLPTLAQVQAAHGQPKPGEMRPPKVGQAAGVWRRPFYPPEVEVLAAQTGWPYDGCDGCFAFIGVVVSEQVFADIRAHVDAEHRPVMTDEHLTDEVDFLAPHEPETRGRYAISPPRVGGLPIMQPWDFDNMTTVGYRGRQGDMIHAVPLMGRLSDESALEHMRVMHHKEYLLGDHFTRTDLDMEHERAHHGDERSQEPMQLRTFAIGHYHTRH